MKKRTVAVCVILFLFIYLLVVFFSNLFLTEKATWATDEPGLSPGVWTPPIGIPHPGNWFLATDSSNVIFVNSGQNSRTFNGTGTPIHPIIYRGVGNPQFGRITITGSYVIVENVRVVLAHVDSAVSFSGNHLALRNSEVAYGPQQTTSAVSIGSNSDIIVYNNTIHDNGDWLIGTACDRQCNNSGQISPPNCPTHPPTVPSCDQDHHGIGGFGGASNIWIVDNEMYHNSGDGMQINAGNASVARNTHHIYVGRNKAHDNKQTGIWVKFTSDVIISQNEIWGHRPSDSSGGTGTGGQYGPERLWIIYNRIYNNTKGISVASDGGPGGYGNGQDTYFVGNIMYNNVESGIDSRETSSRKHVVNNLMFGSITGVDFTNARADTVVVNNLFANINGNDIELWSNHGGIFSYNLCDDSPCSMVQATCTNCVTGNPAFVDADGADNIAGNSDDVFALGSSSAAIDSGTIDLVYQSFQALYGLSIAVDPILTTKPQDGPDVDSIAQWDVGPYEFIATQSCLVSSDCTQRECQIASCTGNVCSYSNIADGTSCMNDTLFCNGVEQCQAGVCAHVNLPCTGTGQTCQEPNQCISDMTPPVISNVQATGITSSGATISWTTNEASSSVVHYGLTTSYGSNAESAGLVTGHAIVLSGLSASTLYHYTVSSMDAVGNNQDFSDRTFNTLTDTNPVGIEVESMTLTNYRVESVTGASSGAVASRQGVVGSPPGIAQTTFAGASGTYDIIVTYCDESDGNSVLVFKINGAVVDSWVVNQNLPSTGCGSTTLVQRVVARARSVSNGNTIRIEGTQNSDEWARVDKIDFIPVAAATGGGKKNVVARAELG